MRIWMRAGAVLIACGLAACGGKKELLPSTGQSLPPRPLGAELTASPSDLMRPEVQARPRRSDELLRKSEERRDDRFDLPPPN